MRDARGFDRFPRTGPRWRSIRFDEVSDLASNEISVKKATYRLIPVDSLNPLAEKGRDAQYRDFGQ